MKRARMSSSDILTGGTKDVNPQLLGGQIATATADTPAVAQIPLPISRFGTSSAKATVVEILKIWVDIPRDPAIGAVGESAKDVFINFSTNGVAVGPAAGNWSIPQVIAYFEFRQIGAFTAGGTYGTGWVNDVHMIDLTDGAGHGVLVGTDSLYVSLDTESFAPNTAAITFKILYRFKSIALAEYIGIVQSQQ